MKRDESYRVVIFSPPDATHSKALSRCVAMTGFAALPASLKAELTRATHIMIWTKRGGAGQCGGAEGGLAQSAALRFRWDGLMRVTRTKMQGFALRQPTNGVNWTCSGVTINGN